MRRLETLALTCLCVCAGVVFAMAAEHRPEIQADWAWQHRWMIVRNEKTGKEELRYANQREQPAPLLDPRAGILKEDRDPTDVVARRVDALLKHLSEAHPQHADWAGMRRRLEPLLAAAKAGKPDLTGKDADRQKTYNSLCALRREIALTNPLLDFDEIVFSEESNVGQVLQRATTGQFNGLAASDPGMGLYIIRGWKGDSPRVVDLCQDAKVENGPYQGQSLSGGMFHAPSLTYDGKIILFSWARLHYTSDQTDKRTADPLRIFRINVDGTGLRQITTDAGGHNDTEPCEMPDGRIVFMSTRREVFDRCIAYRPAFTLCSMKPDGTDILLLSRHETHEWLPSIGNDGMVLYTRWDYVDRMTCAPHGLWSCYPDGRDPRAPNGNYYGNVFTKYSPAYSTLNPSNRAGKGSRQPMTTSHFHAVPGTRKVMAVGSSHHPVEIGPVILIDLDLPDDYAGGQITSVTPGRWGGDGGGEFTAPKPLSQDFFLVSCLDRLYLMDRFGNRELIHRSPAAHGRNVVRAEHRAATREKVKAALVDADGPHVDLLSVNWRPTFPSPVRPRVRPPVIPSQTFQSADRRGQPGHKPATITIQNVYDTDIPLPKDARIKAVRLVQVLGCSTGDYNRSGGVRGGENSAAKLVLGTVPVEADGSVYCLAPIDKGFYFQLLDEDGLAVQSMKSVTYVHAGERLSCRGCHESYSKAARPLAQLPAAMRRAPSAITPESPDGRLRMIDDYVMPAVDRVFTSLDAYLKAGGPPLGDAKDLGGARSSGRRQVGHPAIALIQRGAKGEWFNQIGCPVNNGENDHRTAPDAFGARGSGIWNYLQTHKTKFTGLQKDDLRLFALWLDLLCVSTSHWGERFTTQDAAGNAWPRHPDLDVNNPLGLEIVPAGPRTTAGPLQGVR